MPHASRLRTRFILICLLPLALSLIPNIHTFSAEVTLAWDANTEPDLAGYKIHYGHASWDYPFSVDVGNQTAYTLSDLEQGRTYYFAVTAYDIYGNESSFSNEVIFEAVKIWLEAEEGYLEAPVEVA